MAKTTATTQVKRGQIVERTGLRYVVDSVARNGVIKLRTEGGAFVMFSHINKWLAPKAP